MNLSLFDPPPTIVPPVDTSDPNAVILRVQHKAGPFYNLKPGGVVDRQFYYVVLMNGLVFVEFIDNGERRRDENRITREVIDWMMKAGTWCEVSA